MIDIQTMFVDATFKTMIDIAYKSCYENVYSYLIGDKDQIETKTSFYLIWVYYCQFFC